MPPSPSFVDYLQAVDTHYRALFLLVSCTVNYLSPYLNGSWSEALYPGILCTPLEWRNRVEEIIETPPILLDM
jgi:hypothetical protein